MKLNEVRQCKIKNGSTITLEDLVYYPYDREQVENPLKVFKILEVSKDLFLVFGMDHNNKIHILDPNELEKSTYNKKINPVDLDKAYDALIIFNNIKDYINNDDIPFLNYKELALIFADYMNDNDNCRELIANDFANYIKERLS